MMKRAVGFVLVILVAYLFLYGHRQVLRGGSNPNCRVVANRVPGNADPLWDFERRGKFKNLCLTKRPVGIPGHENLNNYWTGREESWPVEYSKERFATDMKRVMPSTSALTDNAGAISKQALRTTPDSKFYHNPPKYCRENPNMLPCPNAWVKDANAFSGTFTQQRDNYMDPPPPIPGLKQGVFPSRAEFDVLDESFQG